MYKWIVSQMPEPSDHKLHPTDDPSDHSLHSLTDEESHEDLADKTNEEVGKYLFMRLCMMLFVCRNADAEKCEKR